MTNRIAFIILLVYNYIWVIIMDIDVWSLYSGAKDEIKLDEIYSFDKEQLEGTEILKLDDVKITGEIVKDEFDNLLIKAKVKGTMILPCSRTLKPTPYDFDLEIDGDIVEMLEEIDENFKNNQKTLDILPIIWENILMEIPIRVVSDDAEMITKGEGWELVTEEEKVNPSLAKLKDLL